jgi:hypothetical protein
MKMLTYLWVQGPIELRWLGFACTLLGIFSLLNEHVFNPEWYKKGARPELRVVRGVGAVSLVLLGILSILVTL